MTSPQELFEQGRQALQDGLQARAQGKLDEADALYARALTLFERAEQPRAAIITLNNLAATAQLRGQHDRAAELYRDALERADDLDDAPRQALTCGNLGALHLDRGDLTRADLLIRRALDLYTRLEDESGRGNQLGNLGLIASSRGDLPTAQARLTEATGAFLTAGDPLGAGRTLLRLGELARLQGDQPTAVSAFQRACDLLAQAQDLAGLAYGLRSLGQLALREGRAELAEQLFTRGQELHAQMQDARGQSAALVDLANLAELRGDLDKALALRQEAAEQALLSGSRESLAVAELALATTWTAMGALALADGAAQRALLLYEALEQPRGQAAALSTRAAIAHLRGKLDDELSALSRALATSEQGGLIPDQAALLGARAGNHDARADAHAARADLERSAQLHEQAKSLGGAHRARLLLARMDALAHPQRPLDEALADPRLTDARAAFAQSQDADGLHLLASTEALLHRVMGDPAHSAQRFAALADEAQRQRRPLEAIGARLACAEATLKAHAPADPAALRALADEAQDKGAPGLAARALALAARAHAHAQQHDEAAAALAQARALAPAALARLHTGLLETEARLLLAQAKPDEAQPLLARAADQHERAQDLASALDLRALLP